MSNHLIGHEHPLHPTWFHIGSLLASVTLFLLTRTHMNLIKLLAVLAEGLKYNNSL